MHLQRTLDDLYLQTCFFSPVVREEIPHYISFHVVWKIPTSNMLTSHCCCSQESTYPVMICGTHQHLDVLLSTPVWLVKLKVSFGPIYLLLRAAKKSLRML